MQTFSLSAVFAKLFNLASKQQDNIDLSTLEGRYFTLAIDELPQDINLLVENQQFLPVTKRHTVEEHTADVVISGNIKAVLAMLQGQSNIESDDLHITGKISVARDFQRLLSQIASNWQTLCHRFIDAERFSQFSENIEQGIHFAHGSLEKGINAACEHFIKHKKWLVSREEFNDFCQQLGDVENRLEALLQHFPQNT